jgi:hypothetical protein
LIYWPSYSQSVFRNGIFHSLITPGGSQSGGGAPGDGYESSLFAYYKMEDANATSGLNDSTANNLDWTYYSGPNAPITGILGQGFDITTLQWRFSATPANFQFLTHSFTIRFWFKSNCASSDQFNTEFFGDDPWEVKLGSPAGPDSKIDWWIDGAVGTYDTVSSVEIGDGQWHRVIVWWDSGTTVAGVQIDDGTAVTQATEGTLFAPSNPDTAFLLGNIGDGTHFYYIDEVAFWKDYVLSDSDKTFDWNGGAGQTYPLP